MTARILDAVLAAIREGAPVALVTVVGGPGLGSKAMVTPASAGGTLGNDTLDRVAFGDARSMLAQGTTGSRHYGRNGEQREADVEVFIQSFAPPPRMYVFGAIDFSRATVRMGKLLGYYVVVCDARATFATPKRFPEADEVVVRWPHDYLAETAVDARAVLCVLTHDPKFDVPLLAEAVKTPAAYIGAMGSRQTHIDRVRKLRAAGVGDSALRRIRGPIGLDIGARTPEEVAVAIAAEIIALHYGRHALALSDRAGAVHGPAPSGGHAAQAPEAAATA